MKRLKRRHGHAKHKYYTPALGASVRMFTPRGTVMGVVRDLSPNRIIVWTGTTGFGQREWPFDRQGNPVGHTKIAFPDLRLDTTYVDPFEQEAISAWRTSQGYPEKS